MLIVKHGPQVNPVTPTYITHIGPHLSSYVKRLYLKKTHHLAGELICKFSVSAREMTALKG